MRKPVPVCICSDAVLVRSFKLHYGTLCYSFIPGSEIVVDFQGHRRVSKIMKVIFICFECEPTEHSFLHFGVGRGMGLKSFVFLQD